MHRAILTTENIMADLKRKQATLDFELSRCYDPYRLAYLINNHIKDLTLLQVEAVWQVKELEDLDNGD
jgi:hypothetical protein